MKHDLQAEVASSVLASKYELLTLSLISSVESGEDDSTIKLLFQEREEVLRALEISPIGTSAKEILSKAVVMDRQLQIALQEQSRLLQCEMVTGNLEQNALGTYRKAMKGSGSEIQTLV